MELNCPHCGATAEVPGVLIPGARVTTSCSRCGAKFGGTVPARAERSRGEARLGVSDSRSERSGAGAGGSEGGQSSKRSGPNSSRRRKNRGDVPRADRGPGSDQRRDRSGMNRGPYSGESRGGRFSGTKDQQGERRGDTSGERRGGASGDRRGRMSDERDGERTALPVVAKGLNPERLAKLVASDMLLYNREKVERTAEEGCLLSAMAAEIVEAWEFYKGRVGEETAKGTPYFRDAINKILGGSDPIL